MHQWKVPLKYRAMLLFPSGPLGLGGAADTMVWGGVPTKWREQKSTSAYILKLRRNSTGVPYFVTESSSRHHCHCRCRCSPLAITTTTVAPWLHRCRRRHHRHRHCRHHRLPPPSSVIYLIVVFILSSCPLPFLIRWWPSHPPHRPLASLSSSSSWPSLSSSPTTPPPPFM